MDWLNVTNPFLNNTVPVSCCKRNILTVESEPTNATLCQQLNTDYLNTIGCETKLREYIWVVGGVGLGILIFEVLLNF